MKLHKSVRGYIAEPAAIKAIKLVFSIIARHRIVEIASVSVCICASMNW